MFRILAASALTLAALPAAAQEAESYEAGVLRIQNVIGHVEIVSGGSGEIEVSIRKSDPDVPGVEAAVEDGVLTLTGGGTDVTDDYSCAGEDGESGYRRSGMFNLAEARPLNEANDIRITAPDDMELVIVDSVLSTEVESVGAFTLETKSCGEAKIGRIGGEFNLDLRGAYDLNIGSVESAYLDIRGAGDIEIGEMNGELAIDLKGAADISVERGRIDPLVIDLKGAGDIDIGATAVDPEVSIKGVGDVNLDSYEGRLTKEVFGLGDISADCTANCG